MNIAFIPARCGSKSIPLKNIKLFCGKPLIYWSLFSAQKSSSIDKIYVATDCLEIKNTVNSFQFSKVEIYDRKPENAGDLSSSDSVILEFIEEKKLNDEINFALIQATSPLIQPADIDNCFGNFKIEKCDSLLSCVRIKRFFWSESMQPINYNYLNRPRRQDFKGTLMENGAIYISRVKNIKQSKNRISGRISIYEMHENTAIEIDEYEDWQAAESFMKKSFEEN